MNTRPVFHAARRDRTRGMSLIETMVGMTLGILVSLIITQVWSVFENQKQRTISATAGQATGLLALTELEQDVRSAGAGLNDSAAFNCSKVYSYYRSGGVETVPAPAYAGATALAPIEIIDGGATGPDRVIVKRGADFLGAIPATLTSTMPSSSAELNLSTTSGFADGDVVLAVQLSPPFECTVMLVTSVQVAAAKVQHNPSINDTYNPDIPFQTANSWPAFRAQDKVMKIGQTMSREFTVNASSELTVTDKSNPAALTTSALASDIVMLKAQYGIADTGSQTVNAWVSATAAAGGWNVLTPALLKRIKAVRVVIVARSAKIEVPGTTTLAPVAWPDGASPVIDLSATSPDWTRYRYRTYQLVIPIRNVIWANV